MTAEGDLTQDSALELISKVSVVSAGTGQTRRLGKCIGALLRAGDLLLLSGPFGAGKTTLTQGIALGLGIREPVTSPSFTLVNEYRRSDRRAPVLYHVDLYRIEGVEEALGLGLEEYTSVDAICVIEWADQAREVLPAERIEIRMAFLGQTCRTLELNGYGARHAELVRQFQAKCAPMTMGEGDGG